MTGAPVRAFVLDVDGTMYAYGPIRLAMAWRLARYCAGAPREGSRALRIIRAYRRAHEALRAAPPEGSLAEAQVRLAAERAGAEPELVRRTVERWMEREPLDLLERGVRPGLREFLARAAGRGIRLGALSDYPVRRKLEALGIADAFGAIVSAQDPEVNRLKPHPRGLQLVLERLGVEAGDAVYVGDRADVDVGVARAAGAACVLVGRGALAPDAWQGVRDFRHLAIRYFGEHAT